MYIQACTNGRLHDAREASVAPLDRGFLYGDAIYEVWRTYGGVLFAWDEHWSRLRSSAAALFLEIPWSPDDILRSIRRTVAAWRAVTHDTGEVYVRLQITRGTGRIGLDIALAEQPTYVLLVQKLADLTEAQIEDGLALSVARTLRRNPRESLDPAWKTGNYLNNLLCLREAKARGVDEVVILNRDGEVTEAAVSNIAFVRGDGTVVTPPTASGILHGITRRVLLTHLRTGPGWSVVEAPVREEAFASFRECFLISTTKDLAPVASIDAQRFATGPDTVTRRLKAAFRGFAAAHALARPELAVDVPVQ